MPAILVVVVVAWCISAICPGSSQAGSIQAMLPHGRRWTHSIIQVGPISVTTKHFTDSRTLKLVGPRCGTWPQVGATQALFAETMNVGLVKLALHLAASPYTG